MALWPATLPQRPLTDGYSELPGFPVVQAPVDGPSLSRRRYTAAPTEITQSFEMTTTQLEAFRTFYETDCSHGAVPFTWREWGDASRSIYTYKFVEPPQVTNLGGLMWLVSMRIIKLP